jgi:hypothetical protein
MTGLDRSIQRMKAAQRRRGNAPPSPPSGPQLRNPCELSLTGTPDSNGRLLRVRCRCMAGYRSSRKHHGYDHLGDAPTLLDAVRMWRAHVVATVP